MDDPAISGGGEPRRRESHYWRRLGGIKSITLLGGAIVVHPPTAVFTDTGTLDITGTRPHSGSG